MSCKPSKVAYALAMGSIFLLLGVVLFVLLVMILAMVAGVFMRGKPIQHCGSGQIVYKGEKVSCPACEGEDECPDEK